MTGQREHEAREGFKQLGEHRAGCFAVEDDDGLTFISHDGVDYKRKKNGHRGGHTMWHRFVCNDAKCSAELLVRWDVLAKFVNGVKP